MVVVVVVVVVFGVVGTSINIDVLKSELMLQSNSNALCRRRFIRILGSWPCV